MISKNEVLMGRDQDSRYSAEFTQNISDNIDKLLIALNKFRQAYGKPMKVSSGWRPQSVNQSVGGAKASNHVVGLACDFNDPKGEIDTFAIECDKTGLLKLWGLWLEHPDSTIGWCHLDIKHRGDRDSNIFRP